MDYERNLDQFLEFDPDIEGQENIQKYQSAKIDGDLFSLWETLSLYGVQLPQNLGPTSTLDDARVALNAFSKMYQMIQKEMNAWTSCVRTINELESKR